MVLLMLLGVFIVIYSILGFAKRDTESHLKLPWIQTELKGPAWLVSIVVGALLVAAPIIVSAFQKPSNVTIPPPPASVQDVQRIDEPNYRSFRFIRDISILDLRSVEESPWFAKLPGFNLFYKKKNRIRPGVLKNYMVIRKVDTASRIHITYSTSGILDIRCPTHLASYRKANRIIDGKEIESWEVIADVSTIPIGQEFELLVEATYWNGFRGENDEDYATYAHGQSDPEELSVIIMFPEDKPFKNINVTEYPPDSKNGAPVQGQVRSMPGSQNETFYWTTVSQRPNWFYKVSWQW
jgi:hypothetical protein